MGNDIELARGQLWCERVDDVTVIGVIVVKNHDMSYHGNLWEVADFIFKDEKCMGSSLRELMEHEIRRREFVGSINSKSAKIIPFPEIR